MCNSVDEIKGNYMKRYLLRAIKRDISINTYYLDCETESLIEEFFINIFSEYVNEMEKILNKTGFFKNFYKKYMADSIKLANSSLLRSKSTSLWRRVTVSVFTVLYLSAVLPLSHLLDHLAIYTLYAIIWSGSISEDSIPIIKASNKSNLLKKLLIASFVIP